MAPGTSGIRSERLDELISTGRWWKAFQRGGDPICGDRTHRATVHGCSDGREGDAGLLGEPGKTQASGGARQEDAVGAETY